MKIQCPECKAEYEFPDEKIPEKGMRARCKKCGTIMGIRKESGEVSVMQDINPQGASKTQPAGQGAESPLPTPESREGLESVLSQSPEYPKYRDTLIFVAAAVLLALILMAGYGLFKDSDLRSFRIPQNPLESVLRMLKGAAAYDACDSFVRNRERLFEPLGGDIRLSLTRQEVKSVNRRKTARVMVHAEGAKASGQIYFQLRKEGDVWIVTSAALKMGGGKYQTVYPRTPSKTGGKI